MKKENIRLIVNNNDDNIELLYSYLIKMYQGTIWDNALIYYDSNYKNYLTKTVLSANNKFYWLIYEKTIVGFCHLILSPDEVYLNNIFIDERYRCKGLGGKYLYKILYKYINKPNFSLNVFTSNESAYNWYNKLGMKHIDTLFFYKQNKSKGKDKNYEVYKDYNEFTSVYLDKIKVATIINDETVMFNDVKYSSIIDLSSYKKILIKSNCIINSDNIVLYDESNKLTAETKRIIEKLKG